METRQPDEIGTLGEEITGALKAVRAKPSQALSFWLMMGTIIVSSYYDQDATYFLMTIFGGRLGDWGGVNTLLLLVLLVVAQPLWKGRKKTACIELRRGSDSNSSPTLHPQIGTGNTLFKRAIFPFVAFFIGVGLVFLVVRNPNLDGRIFLASIAVLALYSWGTQIEAIFHPFLQVDEDGLQVLSKKLSWPQIERVQVRRSPYNRDAMLWQFFDANDGKLASISIADVYSPPAQQDAMLLALSQALNAKIVISSPATLASQPEASL